MAQVNNLALPTCRMMGLLLVVAAARDEDEAMDHAAYAQAALEEQEQTEFEALPKMQQAVLAVVKHGMGRNEVARIYGVNAGRLSK